jgi:hypothetical protein
MTLALVSSLTGMTLFLLVHNNKEIPQNIKYLYKLYNIR